MSKTGEILIADENKFVPATMPLMRKIHAGTSAIDIEKLSVTPMRGRFPRVVIDVPLILCCAFSLDKDDRLFLHKAAFFNNALVFGSCVAANQDGPFAVAFDINDRLSQDCMKMLRANLKEIEHQQPIWLAVPEDLPIDDSDRDATITPNTKDGTPVEVTLHAAGSIGFTTISRTTLLLPTNSKYKQTIGERALVAMGVATETYAGKMPPTGLGIFKHQLHAAIR